MEAYKSGSGPIFDAVGLLDTPAGKKFRTAAAAQFPSMSAIDATIRISFMRVAVWKQFGFVEHVEYPVLSSDLLYGTLSVGAHTKVSKHIYVSDMADGSYKDFFDSLGKYFCKSMVEYSEMDASTYEDEQEAKQAGGDSGGDEKAD